jgi:hypothetical protein
MEPTRRSVVTARGSFATLARHETRACRKTRAKSRVNSCDCSMGVPHLRASVCRTRERCLPVVWSGYVFQLLGRSSGIPAWTPESATVQGMCGERTVTSVFLDFVRMVVDGDLDQLSKRLAASPALATTPSGAGATRQDASTFFFADIAHYVCGRHRAPHGGRSISASGCGALDRARGRLPSEKPPRCRAASLRGRCQPMASDGAG